MSAFFRRHLCFFLIIFYGDYMKEFESNEALSEETIEDNVDSALDVLSARNESVSEEMTEEIGEESSGEVNEDASEEPTVFIDETPKKNKKTFIASFYEYLETFCYALAVMMVLFLFVFRYVTVDGPSMRETLHHQDKLIISNLFYTPETGDIIVINPEYYGDDNHPIIKRVIATEGQTVRIDHKNWEVYVDGIKLDEPYIEAMRAQEGNRPMNSYGDEDGISEYVIEEGKVFVMGDNRNNSADSRDPRFGQMGENRILGRVIIRITPDFGFVE